MFQVIQRDAHNFANEECFFVRHAYFCGGDEPYDKLKRALKAEIDEGGLVRRVAHQGPALRPAQDRADRGQGDQPLWG